MKAVLFGTLYGTVYNIIDDDTAKIIKKPSSTTNKNLLIAFFGAGDITWFIVAEVFPAGLHNQC